MSLPKWASDFEPPALFRTITVPWFSLFQVVSAYTNTGTSLVDQNMVPFQTAYPMIFFMIFCILAGNTAFPIMLRFLIWIITKLVPRDSRLDETLHFLLDHPRRCFVYLFPSYQTWFLLTILVIMNLTDWFCFLVLDIGNPDIDSIPLGTRVVAGLYQAIAVRAAGFGIVPLARIAPAVKVIYVIMMYVSVYPIALSVRSTNVYEEQSLGIYKDDPEDEDAFSTTGPRMTVWSRYLAMHARRQLAFDMWWLCLALVLVCIIERGNLDNTEIQGWFNIFTIIFELVSAYGSVGLSLGIPNENYSFSGALKPLSKLIVCLVMLRGRHRGLPVAIDRAIMLPSEFEKTDDEAPPPVTQSPHSESVHTRDPLPKEDGSASSNEGPDYFEGRLKKDDKRTGSCDVFVGPGRQDAGSEVPSGI
jgi:potassium uptake Trk family protein